MPRRDSASVEAALGKLGHRDIRRGGLLPL